MPERHRVRVLRLLGFGTISGAVVGAVVGGGVIVIGSVQDPADFFGYPVFSIVTAFAAAFGLVTGAVAGALTGAAAALGARLTARSDGGAGAAIGAGVVAFASGLVAVTVVGDGTVAAPWSLPLAALLGVLAALGLRRVQRTGLLLAGSRRSTTA